MISEIPFAVVEISISLAIIAMVVFMIYVDRFMGQDQKSDTHRERKAP